MKKLFDFLSYHNAVPVALGILFLGAGGALAATPAVQQAVYSSAVVVQSIDNTRIVNADLDAYPFSLLVTGVEEDDTSYFVSYSLQTIELADGAWQDVTKSKTITVPKAFLEGKDLGLYATKELAEVRDHERARLKETQQIEKSIGASQKVVATVYSGLVGALLDSKTETFPTYTPVIPDVVKPAENAGGGIALASVGSAGPASSDTQPPALTLVGSNPTRIPLNAVYVDQGVIMTDNAGVPTLELLLDGAVVQTIAIDTSRVWTYFVTYRATDAAGNVTEVRRDVVIGGSDATPLPPPPEHVPEQAPDPIPEELTPQATTTQPELETGTTTASSTP